MNLNETTTRFSNVTRHFLDQMRHHGTLMQQAAADLAWAENVIEPLKEAVSGLMKAEVTGRKALAVLDESSPPESFMEAISPLVDQITHPICDSVQQLFFLIFQLVDTVEGDPRYAQSLALVSQSVDELESGKFAVVDVGVDVKRMLRALIAAARPVPPPETRRIIGWRVGIISHNDVPDLDAPIDYYLSGEWPTSEEASSVAQSWNRAEAEDNAGGGAFRDVACAEPIYENEHN